VDELLQRVKKVSEEEMTGKTEPKDETKEKEPKA